jgi:hypothetical protein
LISIEKQLCQRDYIIELLGEKLYSYEIVILLKKNWKNIIEVEMPV